MPSCFEREHRLAAHVRACVERGQVEVAALVEHLGGARVAEQEVLELGADVEGVEAHRVRALERAPQHVPRVALIRGALGRDDVAEHAPHPLLLGAPRQDRERAGVGHRDHVGLLDRVEASDRRAVEAHARLERVVELRRVDRERLQLAEDVGEPEADEADVALRDDRLHVLRGVRLLLCHPRGPYTMAPARRHRRLAKDRGALTWPATAATKAATSFGFLALYSCAGIWPRPRARPSRIALEHERLAPAGGGGDVVAHAHVEVRADAAHRLDGRERVADRAGAREQFAAF